MLILDSKTISNADTARVKGYDAGKEIRNQTAYWSRYPWFATYHPDYSS